MTPASLADALRHRNDEVTDMGGVIAVAVGAAAAISISLDDDVATVVTHDWQGLEVAREVVPIGPDEDSRAVAVNRIACAVLRAVRAVVEPPRRRRAS